MGVSVGDFFAEMQVDAKARQLGLENQQGQCIHEAAEHPLGHEAHLMGQS